MSLEELRNIDAKRIPVGKLLYIIGKGYSRYVNHQLSEFEINTTQLHLLFEISDRSDLNQDKIATRCNINKGAVARSIKKLEDNGFVTRKIVEKSTEILKQWENEVILDKGYIEKELLQKILKEIAVKTIELNNGGCE